MSVVDTPVAPERLRQVASVLITQPRPSDEKSPYFELARRYEIKVDFRPFVEVEPVSLKDFRKQKIDILAHTGVIFTSRNAVDNLFRIISESKIEMPPDMKYFCISEQTANYLQKYITVRKRKVFVGEKTAADMLDVLKKHKNEKFLFPCSDIRKNDIPDFMDNGGFQFTEAILYRTVASDLSDLEEVTYDIIAFFSPSGITSLYKNFPDFQQNNTRIAAFGPTTAKAVREAGLVLDIEAPMPNAPSMTGALEVYIKKVNVVEKD
jgi:uroporphyrinogen-III synthase